MDTTRLATRRSLLLGIPALALARTAFSGGAECRAREEALRKAAGTGPCAKARPFASLVADGEPGTPLVVTGHVVKADGVTPAAGAILYVYQTDVTGLYAKRDGDPPRLRAFLRTDAAGRYEYRTIRPLPYPRRDTPAHIHTQLWGENVPPQWNTDLEFADDALVTDRARRHSESLERFAFVKPTTKRADGVLQAVHDIRLKDRADDFEGNIRHGLAECGLG